mmetsp:Transcript_80722/g.134919  ORF Transcript_80722/g.134919 Transcript_80722/m.134919 type:complete len:314 (-) Transcript_80722:224-1165(-)
MKYAKIQQNWPPQCAWNDAVPPGGRFHSIESIECGQPWKHGTAYILSAYFAGAPKTRLTFASLEKKSDRMQSLPVLAQLRDGKEQRTILHHLHKHSIRIGQLNILILLQVVGAQPHPIAEPPCLFAAHTHFRHIWDCSIHGKQQAIQSLKVRLHFLFFIPFTFTRAAGLSCWFHTTLNFFNGDHCIGWIPTEICPSQLRHMSATSQQLAQIIDDAANVCPFGAVDLQPHESFFSILQILKMRLQQLQLKNCDRPRLPWHFDALSSIFIQRFSLVFQSRPHGRYLLNLSPKCVQSFFKLNLGYIDRAFRHHLSL